MTPEERGLVDRLFQRLKSADRAPKDREAEDLINRLVVQQPAAPYLLTQIVLVQEHALGNAQARIAQLEAELAGAKREEPGAGGRTSFLGGLAESGPWGARESASAPSQAVAPSATRAAGGSVPVTASPAGGGFLHQALATMAGVAGGALLFDGIRSVFHQSPGPFGPALGSGRAQPTGSPTDSPAEASVLNDYGGGDVGHEASATDHAHDASGADLGTSGPAGAVDASVTPDEGGQPNDQGGFEDADLGGEFDGGGTDFGGGDDSSFA